MSQDKVVSIKNLQAGESVELFSGCGGLALGLSKAGFRHRVLVEWDNDACSTLEHNKRQGLPYVKHWRIEHRDVRIIDWTAYRGIKLVAGGPPCQPFSIGGKASGHLDERDMWPEAIRAVREIWPDVFLFENVKGLLRSTFADYVRWIQLYLSQPDLKRKPRETHPQHLMRLEATRVDAAYDVMVVPVNAADYGVAQKRHRVIVAGVRRDLRAELVFPRPTHTQERLVWDKWITGEYWKRHGIKRPEKSTISWHEARIAQRFEGTFLEPEGSAWVTCRDAFEGLGEAGTRPDIANHNFQPGARSYPGHTGSPIDEPAKALKAGVHGVPGGENMLSHEGDVRYFSVREAARLQGLPDDFTFTCSWTESMRQIGNAVPVPLSKVLGVWIANMLHSSAAKRRAA